MPPGRPRKPGTREEKAAQRREQIRQNVRAFRERKKAFASSSPQQQQDEVNVVEVGHEFSKESFSKSPTPAESLRPGMPLDFVARISPLTTDMNRVSGLAPIELTFGALPAIVNDFHRATGRFPWQQAVLQLHRQDRLVEIAVLAAGTRWLSRMYDNEKMTQFARLAYHRALQGLQKQISDPDMRDILELSTIINALMVFEGCDGSPEHQNPRWVSHVGAAMQLTQAAGPNAYSSTLGVQVLRGIRPMFMIQSAFSRQPSVLDSDEWRTAPFSGAPKQNVDQLFELIDQVPGLLKCLDVLKVGLGNVAEHASFEAALDLQARLFQMKNAFENWMARYEAENCFSLYHEMPSSPAFVPGFTHVFPTSIHFNDPAMAETLVTYWAWLLQLSVAALDVNSFIGDSMSVTSENAVECITEKFAATLAKIICASLESAFGPNEHDLRGVAYCGLLPLWAAMQYFAGNAARYSEELEWCSKVGGIVIRRGIRAPGVMYMKKSMMGDRTIPWADRPVLALQRGPPRG